MINNTFLSFIFIIVSSIVMFINIKIYSNIGKILNLIPNKKRKFLTIAYTSHLVLMYIFVLANFFTEFCILSNSSILSLTLFGLMCLFGSVFILIGIMIQSSMLNLINETYLQTVKALTTAIEARDKYTMGHSQHVANLSLLISKNADRNHDNYMLEFAALLHDVGKIGIPENILNKPDKLNEFELDIIKTHPKLGSQIIGNIDGLNNISKWILYHHERIDGNGYYHLAQENIPFQSKIIAVADTFSALVTDRPYRKGMTCEQAFEILKNCSGNQLDSELVDIFINLPIDKIKKCKPIHF